MKVCAKCEAEKSQNEFSRHKGKPDGLQHWCKVCKAEQQRDYRQKPAVKAASAAASRKHYSNNTEVVKTYQREHRQTDAGKAAHQRGNEKWNNKNPEKHRAHKILQEAVQSGLILKPDTCSSCNDPVDPKILHGHHEDYSKPLDADWLCPQCHVDLHKKVA